MPKITAPTTTLILPEQTWADNIDTFTLLTPTIVLSSTEPITFIDPQLIIDRWRVQGHFFANRDIGMRFENLDAATVQSVMDATLSALGNPELQARSIGLRREVKSELRRMAEDDRTGSIGLRREVKSELGGRS